MPRANAGFSLIEVLVAMVTFAIAAAATSSLMFNSSSFLAQANGRSEAIAIAQTAIERLRTQDYADMDLNSYSVAWKGHSGFFSVTPNISTDDPGPGMKTVVVEVSWQNKGETETYELQTVYSDIDS
jgi:prepilin-type N-terminal cleavage/methylation domain-containing protein